MNDWNSQESEIVAEFGRSLRRALDEVSSGIDEICEQYAGKFSNSIIYEELDSLRAGRHDNGRNAPDNSYIEGIEKNEEIQKEYFVWKKLNSAESASTVNYLAISKNTKKQVVIKQLVRSSSSQVTRDAEALIALDHQNIKKILDVDKKNTPPHYLVMEYVDGHSLHQLINKAPLHLSRIIEICIPILDALCAAHSKDLYHLDMKPENVLVDHDDHVKLIDFGLARYAGESDGRPIGTSIYRAPEQFVGDYCKRTDVFGFGTILYELLFGIRFWTGPSIHQLKLNPPNEYRDRWNLVPDCLKAVLENCLHFSRKRRYQTANALRDELVEYCQKEIATSEYIGNKYDLYGTNPQSSMKFSDSCRASIGLILSSTSQLLAEFSDIGRLGLRAFCHILAENETLIPLVVYAGRNHKDVDTIIPCNDPEGFWKISKSFTRNEYICEDAENRHEKAKSTEDVWDQLRCVAAHPIRPTDKNDCPPLGTVSFDAAQSLEVLKWDRQRKALVQRTLEQCAESIYLILKNDTTGKS